ncbi:MAG: phage terminase large subunit [Planctomycetota bacterium]
MTAETPNTTTFHALPKQLAFINSEHRETMLCGGLGSGKSLALCLRLAMRASVKGARELLIRKTNAAIGRSILHTLLRGDGQTPPVLPAGAYDHAKTEQTIRIKGGGEIVYSGVDDPQRLGSVNATGAAVEEAVELAEQDYRMVRGRVRVELPGLKPSIYLATNPGGPTHHLAKRFGLDEQSKPEPGCIALTVATDENPHLPTEYVQDIGRLAGADRGRFFEGRWVKAEGLVYPGFDTNTMVQHRDEQWAQVVVGQDAGFNDPDALLVVCRDHAGRVHVADEFCGSGLLTDQVVEEAHKLRERYGASIFAVDPSAARLRAELEQAELPVVKAENAVLDGIRAVQRYMMTEGDGTPRFTVEPHSVHLLRELASYAWHPDRTDVPIDRNNHLADALRYGVCQLDGFARSVYIGGSMLEEDDDDHETYSDAWHAAGFGDPHDPFSFR